MGQKCVEEKLKMTVVLPMLPKSWLIILMWNTLANHVTVLREKKNNFGAKSTNFISFFKLDLPADSLQDFYFYSSVFLNIWSKMAASKTDLI